MKKIWSRNCRCREEEAQKLNLELVKLQITLENVKKTAAVAVLPAMTEMVKAFDKFVSGPGAAIVKQFGEWLASLNIDWKAVSAGIVSITEALTKFFAGPGSYRPTNRRLENHHRHPGRRRGARPAGDAPRCYLHRPAGDWRVPRGWCRCSGWPHSVAATQQWAAQPA